MMFDVCCECAGISGPVPSFIRFFDAHNHRKISRVWPVLRQSLHYYCTPVTKSQNNYASDLSQIFILQVRFCEEKTCLVRRVSCMFHITQKTPEIGVFTPNPTCQAWIIHVKSFSLMQENSARLNMLQANFKQYHTYWYYLSIFCLGGWSMIVICNTGSRVVVAAGCWSFFHVAQKTKSG